jgi:proteasome lid subunit RPN8/RPN11
MAKQYVSPEIDIVEVDANDGNRYSLPYGIAKGLGLDTTGMRPREVWEMLKGRGVTPENEYDKLKEKAEKELPKEEPEVVDSLYREEQKEKIQRFRNEHQKKTHEFGLVLDENGNTLVYREGKTGSVSFYASEYKNFKGASIIHNHPQANTFLSPADIQMFMETNLRSIEAIGFDGWVHSIELMPKENSQMIFGM